MIHPAPEVSRRTATEDEIPTGAKRLMKTARESGWTARVTYAKGTNLDAQGRPSSIVESIVVRLVYPDRWLAVGSWWDGKFHAGWTADTSGYVTRRGARELAQFVRDQ